MVAEPTARFDDDQVEPKRHPRQCDGTQRTELHEPERRTAEPDQLCAIHRFLGETVVAPRAPADLDDHERRPGLIDRDEVQLCAPDADLPAEDRPAGRLEPRRDQRLRGIAGQLRIRSHGISIAGVAYAPVTSDPTSASASDQMIAAASAITAAAPGSNVTTP